MTGSPWRRRAGRIAHAVIDAFSKEEGQAVLSKIRRLSLSGETRREVIGSEHAPHASEN